MRKTLTPSMLRRKQMGLPSDDRPLEPAPLELMPHLEPPGNRDFDAASDWLAHVQAGRIQVR